MSSNKSILFVSHDVNRAGAQLFIFNVMIHLKKVGHEVVLLSKATWGSMANEFENNFPVYYLEKKYKKGTFSKNTACLNYLKSTYDFNVIYLNTIACVDLLGNLKQQFQIPIYSHIHELPYSIQQFGPENASKDLFSFSDKIIACSNAVKENLSKHGNPDKISLVHSFVNNETTLKRISETSIFEIKKKYQLPLSTARPKRPLIAHRLYPRSHD